VEQILMQADQSLNGLWRDMFQVLVIHGLLVSNKAHLARSLIERLAEPWRHYLSAPA
jgi:hypothetical protein